MTIEIAGGRYTPIIEPPAAGRRRPPATIGEIGDRVRRIEMRLTSFLASQGFDTKTQRPVFNDGIISIPSMDCSVKDILATVPAGYLEIEVHHKTQYVMSFYTTQE